MVYAAITMTEMLDGWFTNGDEIDARVGGFVRFWWVEQGVDRIEARDGGLRSSLEKALGYDLKRAEMVRWL